MTINYLKCALYCISCIDTCNNCEYKNSKYCKETWRNGTDNEIEDVVNNILDILTMIQNTNENSATKCWETINIIKEKY